MHVYIYIYLYTYELINNLLLQLVELNETMKKFMNKKRVISAVVAILVTAIVVTGVLVGI